MDTVLRAKLVEMAVEQDDDVLEHYLESGEDPDVATLKKCIRKVRAAPAPQIQST